MLRPATLGILFAIVCFELALSGCAKREETAHPHVTVVPTRTLELRCGDVNGTVMFAADTFAVLKVQGETFGLHSVPAASGARYSGGQYIWWVKGNQADLVDFRNGGMEAVITCQAQ